MNLRKIVVPVLGVGVVVLAWQAYGWRGVAVAATGIVMWALLHFTRLMKVMQRAADRPVGYCDSAVMVNAKLRAGVNLLHVVALTRSLGEQLSPKDEDPEVFRWTDGSASHVTCEFRAGKLVKWTLVRPQPAEEAAVAAPAPEAGAPPAAP